MADKDKEEIALNDAERFSENCFLHDNIETLAKSNYGAPYTNFVKINDDPGLVIQELLGKKGMESLFAITPAQVALIVPTIRLFEVDYTNNKKKGDDVPFIFQDFTSPKTLSDIVNNKSGRGEDAGIKSFEYEFAGKNLAEGGLLTCKLSLYFNSPKALLGKSESGASFRDLVYYPPTDKDKEACGSAYNPKSFRIKAIVGWGDMIDPKGMLIPANSDLKKAVSQMKTALFLHLTSHDIDFKENGVLEAQLTYRGAMEGVLSGEASDIFWITETGKSAQKLKDKQAQIEADKEKKKNTGTQAAKPPALPEEKKKEVSFTPGGSENQNREYLIAQGEDADKQTRYSRLIKALWTKGRVFYTDVDDSMVSQFTQRQREELREKGGLSAEILKTGMRNYRDAKSKENEKGFGVNKKPLKLKITRIETSDYIQSPITKAAAAMREGDSEQVLVGGTLQETWYGALIVKDVKYKSVRTSRSEEEKQKELAGVADNNYTANLTPGTRRLMFFFLGDLLDAALSVLTDGKRDDNHNLRTLIGPYIFTDPRTGKRTKYNLANIPISLTHFYSWYINKVIKVQRPTYYLGEFIKDVLSELVIDMIKPDGCYISNRQIVPHIGMTILTVPDLKNTMKPGSAVTLQDLRGGVVDGKIGSTGTHYDIKDLAHYLYVYVTNESVTSMRGNYEEDVKKGIYHVVLGADNGLVKSIKFSKNNAPYAKEAMATNDTVDQHRVPGYYNANITMIGNSMFNVGTMIYIDTRRLTYGNSTDLATSMRIGGYYKIIKVNNVISKDDFTTEITAKWEQDANGISSGACAKKAAGEKVKSDKTTRQEASTAVGEWQAKFEKEHGDESKQGQSAPDVRRALNTK